MFYEVNMHLFKKGSDTVWEIFSKESKNNGHIQDGHVLFEKQDTGCFQRKAWFQQEPKKSASFLSRRNCQPGQVLDRTFASDLDSSTESY